MEDIGALERRLWSSADTLRANSPFASNEYFLPVMGLIFLRHAYSRFIMVKEQIEAVLPMRGGNVRSLTKEDFSQKGAIYLHPDAQFEYLVSLPDGADRAQAIINAMESIERDYDTLRGALPKSEYQELDNDVLGQILRTFNDPALKRADGDIFGRIYEYFLTQFADQKAHDGGEFFTPVSLVQMIVNVIEPDHGRVLDPACGSAGMFVQSAHFIERMHRNPTERATFYGMEKNPTTIRLANMNLAVHGLEGIIHKANTYYEDPHELHGKCDFLMANPPFNVDEVDGQKVKNDPRLPFGLPGVNKKGKVSNGNYLWISYFDSYLNDLGRAGFVMSSQASSAGGKEANVRKRLIEADHVDVMMAIRPGFFYTRSVPCELWFLDKAKPGGRCGKILMVDAREIYRKVTRKIHDFAPEQLKNISAIVWLYRGQVGRFEALVANHLERMVEEAKASIEPLRVFTKTLNKVRIKFANGDLPGELRETVEKLETAEAMFDHDVRGFDAKANEVFNSYHSSRRNNDTLNLLAKEAQPLIELSQDLVRQIDYQNILISTIVNASKKNGRGSLQQVLHGTKKAVIDKLSLPLYFWRQARWLQERFPDAELRNVQGLVKVVSLQELNANDCSLSPGRYVGVAPEEEDDDFDFEQVLREIHVEIEALNQEAAELAGKIAENYKELSL